MPDALETLNIRALHKNIMAAETVTISRAEYDNLKRLEKIDHSLIAQLAESLEDAKHGRIRRVA